MKYFYKRETYQELSNSLLYNIAFNNPFKWISGFVDALTLGFEDAGFKSDQRMMTSELEPYDDTYNLKAYTEITKIINELKDKYEKKSPKKTVERKKLTREEEAIIKEQERNRREEKEDKEREEKERNKQKKRNEKEEEERKAKAIKAFQEAEKLKESDRRKKRKMMTKQERDAEDYEKKQKIRTEKLEKERAKFVSKEKLEEEEKEEKEEKERESKKKREEAKKQLKKEKAKKEKDDENENVDEEIKFYADVMNNNVFGWSIFEREYDIDPIKLQNSGRKYKNVKLKTNLLEFEDKSPTSGNIGWFKQTKTIIGGRDFINNSKAKERVKLVELAKKEIKNMKQNEEDLEKYEDIVKNNEFYQHPSIRKWSKGNNKVYVKNVRIKDGALLFDRITDDDIGFEVVEEGGKWKWYKEKHILKSGRDAKERKEKPKKEEMKQDEKELEKFMKIVEKYELKEKISKMPSDKLFIKNVKFDKNLLKYDYITASQAKTNKPFKKEVVVVSMFN